MVVGCAAQNVDPAAVAPDDKLESITDQGIVNGTATSDFLEVGFLSQGGSSFCTGTLIGPRRVLTARHCIEAASSRSQLLFGLGDDDNLWQADLYIVDGFALYDGADLAILDLRRDAPYQGLPILDRAVRLYERPILVGFGRTSQWGGSGEKRMVDVQVHYQDASQWYYLTSQRGACFGDSGGPALLQVDGQWVIAGVAQAVFGPTCLNGGTHARVDTLSRRSFFDGVRTAPPLAACSLEGEFCTIADLDDDPAGAFGCCVGLVCQRTVSSSRDSAASCVSPPSEDDEAPEAPSCVAQGDACSIVANDDPCCAGSYCDPGGRCEPLSFVSDPPDEPAPSDTAQQCSDGMGAGICMDMSVGTCPGRDVSGLCPGPANVRCCIGGPS